MVVSFITAVLSGCSSSPVAAPDEAEVATSRPVVLTEVHLPPLAIKGSLPHEAELRGLLTAAFELGLSDLPGVVPLVTGDATPLALLAARPPARRQVDARLVASGTADALQLELETCVAGGECVSTVATATAASPWPAVGTLLGGAAAALDVDVAPEVAEAWSRPGSKDSYSELITGRAAAQLYGILPPSLTPGDRKLDPVQKAVYLDPAQPLAQWVRARWEAATTVDGGKAADALAKAQLSRPTSPLLAADQATLLSLTGHTAEAQLAWETIAATAGGDPRWLLPVARARLAAGHAEAAVDGLADLPPEFAWDAAVAALRVAATEAAGSADLDPLLARWQAVAADNPEPVRRRIDARVRAGSYAEAEELLGALRDRAPGPATDALEVALLVSLGRFEAAAALAPAELRVRIDARARAAVTPGWAPDALAEDDALRPLFAAESALWNKDLGGALRAAEQAVALAPANGEGFALRARALEALGRGEDAAAAWTQAWELDPALPGGPVSGRRIASTFRYVEEGEAPTATGDAAGTGPKGPEL